MKGQVDEGAGGWRGRWMEAQSQVDGGAGE